jgi:carbon storage regulator
MLIVKRREGETIHIGDDVVITFLSGPESPQIKVGIKAPEDTLILRGELLEDDDQD